MKKEDNIKPKFATKPQYSATPIRERKVRQMSDEEKYLKARETLGQWKIDLQMLDFFLDTHIPNTKGQSRTDRLIELDRVMCESRDTITDLKNKVERASREDYLHRFPRRPE
jgi:hypothetical protein